MTVSGRPDLHPREQPDHDGVPAERSNGAHADSLLDEITGLRKAMEHRAVIEQAKGIIIAAMGCDADAAFAVLVEQSQHQNRKVREVAEDLVRSRIRDSQ